MSGERGADERRAHILTVSVEDYFHVGAFASRVLPKHWERLEPRLERSLEETLTLLRRGNAKATFFVLGSIAERNPEIVGRIVEAGHEIASSGYWPRGLSDMVPEEFREDLGRTKEALEKAGANPVVGYRAARSWLRQRDIWALRILAEEGYLYDSSVNPVLRRFPSDPALYEVGRHRLAASDLHIWEFPIATVGLFGLRVAISGGNYIRQFPHTLLRRATNRWSRDRESPMVFYFMPWELDGQQPQIRGISWITRLRHYRNLGKARWVFEHYFERYRFEAIGDHLGIDYRKALRLEPSRVAPKVARAYDPEAGAPTRVKVSIVVPLYNEEENIRYLRRTLSDLRRRLGDRYSVYLVLVDDGSEDRTWEHLEESFGQAGGIHLVRHPENRGVAAAIETGIQEARTEIVCSIDCDCSYDPTRLGEMIPLIQEADVVTASPYHREGSVFNVPGWRLLLSRSLSRIYNRLLGESISTYTSCFRVYRKSWIAGLTAQRRSDFVGIAEMLIQTLLVGGRVVEYPTVLEARLLGVSKMRTLDAIWRHLGLLSKLAFRRSSVAPQAPGSK